MKLIEPFKDFEVELNSYSYSKRYPVVRKIRPKKYPLQVDEEKIKKVVEALQKKYPDKQYRYKIVTYKGKKYAVIRRGNLSYKNPPVYICLDDGKIYVPESYYKREPHLVNFIVMVRLYDLGGI